MTDAAIAQDLEGSGPLYRRVRANLLARMAAGEWGVDGKLPSERELMAGFGVSRITLRQALTELVQAGRLRAHAGKGFFVVPARAEPFEMHLLQSFTENAAARGLAPGMRLLEGRIGPAPAEVTEALALPRGAPVLHLRRLRLLDGAPVVLQSDWLDPALVPGLLTLGWGEAANLSLLAILVQRYGLAPRCGESRISARLATPEERRLLELPDPAPVLTLDQSASGTDRRVINVSAAVHHPGRYPMRIREG